MEVLILYSFSLRYHFYWKSSAMPWPYPLQRFELLADVPPADDGGVPGGVKTILGCFFQRSMYFLLGESGHSSCVCLLDQ